MSNVVASGLLAVVLLVAVAQNLFRSRVSRHRLERFARREALPITPDNGNLVIRYLAVTRRWRTLGLLVAVVSAGAWSLRDQHLNINLLAALGGWFVGAVVAELRVAAVGTVGPRAASLEPRLLRDRLRPPARWLPIVMAVAIVTVAVALLVRDPAVQVLGLLALGLAEFVVPLAVGRYVLQRSQPSNLAPDVRAADDARRDRSLHVLAGSSIALLGYPLAELLARAAGGTGDGAGALLLLLALVAGWAVATTSRSRRQPRLAPGKAVPS